MTRGKRSKMIIFDDMMDNTSIDNTMDKYIKSISDNKLDYRELREEIHKILCEFLSHEHPLQNDGEFDFEFLEFSTDDILRLIRRQGGTIT